MGAKMLDERYTRQRTYQRRCVSARKELKRVQQQIPAVEEALMSGDVVRALEMLATLRGDEAMAQQRAA